MQHPTTQEALSPEDHTTGASRSGARDDKVGIWFYLVVVFGILDLLGGLLFLPGAPRRLDFSIFYTCAVAMRRGLDPYAINLIDLAREFHFQRPPFPHAGDTPTFMLVTEPLALFSPRVAFAIWNGASLLCLGVSLYWLFGPSSQLGRREAAFFTVAALGFGPLSLNFFFSQSQNFVLFGLMLFHRLLRHQRGEAAGALLAALGLLRAYPLGLGGHLVARRQWRAIGTLAIAFAAGIALTVVGVGIATVEDFLHVSGIIGHSDWLSAPMWLLVSPLNLSLASFVGRPLMLLFGSPLTPGPRRLCQLTVLLADAAILVSAFRATADKDDDRSLPLWVVTMLIVSPVVWIHYTMLLVVPLGMIAVAAARYQTGARVWRLATYSYAFNALLAPAIIKLTVFGGVLSWRMTAFSELGFLALFSAWIAARRFALEAPRESDDAPGAQDFIAAASRPEVARS